MGVGYSGKTNMTVSGITCQVWNASHPHEHNFTYMGEHNFCRNPNGDPEGVWCYTSDPEIEREYCSVPNCDQTKTITCQLDLTQGGDPLGLTYTGRLNTTLSGKTCQVWALSVPHEHPYTDVGEHNYCRNPNRNQRGVWCYTTDPDMRKEYCEVPICDPTCQRGYPPGQTYTEESNVTVSGRSCQVWAATEPHDHKYTHVGYHNNCRNPDGDSFGVWCFTTDPNKIWEYCSVPRCEQTCQEGFPLGVSYSGNLNVTASGISCQAWSASQPHEHTFTDVGEHNHCRNPNGDLLGAWCFTTD